MATRVIRTRSKTPDPIALLLDDHKRLKQYFARFGKLRSTAHGSAQLQQVVELACEELELHATIEEQIFYPAIRAQVRQGLVDEAEVEHEAARAIIAELRRLEPADTKYTASFRVLITYITRHMKEEEQRLFPRIRRARIDMADLGHRMLTLRKSLLGEQDADRAAPTSQTDDEAVQRHAHGGTRYRDLARH
jgi:iron-sulfur cluster repair protein YtfE (RIC family)